MNFYYKINKNEAIYLMPLKKKKKKKKKVNLVDTTHQMLHLSFISIHNNLYNPLDLIAI